MNLGSTKKETTPNIVRLGLGDIFEDAGKGDVEKALTRKVVIGPLVLEVVRDEHLDLVIFRACGPCSWRRSFAAMASVKDEDWILLSDSRVGGEALQCLDHSFSSRLLVAKVDDAVGGNAKVGEEEFLHGFCISDGTVKVGNFSILVVVDTDDDGKERRGSRERNVLIRRFEVAAQTGLLLILNDGHWGRS